MPVDLLRNRVSPPGVLSSAPMLSALAGVIALCLFRAGILFKQNNRRRARNWVLAAVVCAVLWGLVALVLEAFGSS